MDGSRKYKNQAKKNEDCFIGMYFKLSLPTLPMQSDCRPSRGRGDEQADSVEAKAAYPCGILKCTLLVRNKRPFEETG
jgi:hypothetical protein